jgi:hypothetical protein
MSTHQLTLLTVENLYQARTVPSKLRGQYYTPDELVQAILDELRIAPEDVIIDPSCGDGSFLRGTVARLARCFPDWNPEVLAKHWTGKLIGLDSNEAAVMDAKAGLRAAFREHLGIDIPQNHLQIRQVDVLQFSNLDVLFRKTSLAPLNEGDRLLVVGNPPYVEAKRLSHETKATLKTRFPDAVAGAPDLYLYFLHVCLSWLRKNDCLAFVLPNKLLVNSNAQSVRTRLLVQGRLRSLWFATQARIFPTASVYPIILFASGERNHAHLVKTIRITRSEIQALRRERPINIRLDWYQSTAARAFFPPPETPVLRGALEKLLRFPIEARLDALLDIRWSVSFHRAGLREQYVMPHSPGSTHARRFLGGGPFSGNGEVARYHFNWGGWWIDYDEERLRRQRNPVPPLALFEQPKLVICQNGRTLRAAYDEEGYVLKDTFLCGLPRLPEHPLARHPRALVGLLCSRAVHFFYAHVFYGGHVSGGYLHFLRSFLVDVPVGRWSEDLAAETARLVAVRETARTAAEPEALEDAIEAHVAAALGLTPEEEAAIRAWSAEDENWQARERVRGPKGGTFE